MIFRWVREGIDGIKLETCKEDGTQYTSTQAIARFVEATGRGKNQGKFYE